MQSGEVNLPPHVLKQMEEIKATQALARDPSFSPLLPVDPYPPQVLADLTEIQKRQRALLPTASKAASQLAQPNGPGKGFIHDAATKIIGRLIPRIFPPTSNKPQL